MSKKTVNGQDISNEPSENRYFTMIPNIAFIELDLYELALYSNYRRTCGNGGTTYKSNRTLAKETGMSVSKIQRCRDSLAEKKYIKVTHTPDENGIINTPPDVIVCDIWKRNVNYFAPMDEDATPSTRNTPPPVSDTNPLVPDTTKEDTFKKIDLKEEKNTSLVSDNGKKPLSVQATDLIKTWLDSHPVKPIDEKNPYNKKGYHKQAELLVEAGITCHDVERFVKAQTGVNGWYKNKKLPFGKVASDIAGWLLVNSIQSTTPKQDQPNLSIDEITRRVRGV